MQIRNSCSYQPNFQQISTVRIKKSAFKNPQDMVKCSIEMNKALGQGFGLAMVFKSILHLFGVKLEKLYKFQCIDKDYGYDIVRKSLDQSNSLSGCSVNWASQNIGLPIKTPEETGEDAYSFYIFTGEDKNEAYRRINPKALLQKCYKQIPEIAKKYSGNPDMAGLFISVCMGHDTDAILEKITSGKEIKKYEASTLDDVSELAKVL